MKIQQQKTSKFVSVIAARNLFSLISDLKAKAFREFKLSSLSDLSELCHPDIYSANKNDLILFSPNLFFAPKSTSLVY